MKDYHTHIPTPHGGYLCSVTREDWPRVAAAAEGMTPCFGIHPWHAADADPAELAFELDDWLSRHPQADVGETGLDGNEKHRDSMEAQRILLHIHLGAAFRHDRMAHLHGSHAWGEIENILRERHRTGTLPRVLLHAWNGSPELARRFLSLGCVFSVGLRELLNPKAAERYAAIPREKLFPESDDRPETFTQTVALLAALKMN